eukprot:4271554-Amphidinium_carterae.2
MIQKGDGRKTLSPKRGRLDHMVTCDMDDVSQALFHLLDLLASSTIEMHSGINCAHPLIEVGMDRLRSATSYEAEKYIQLEPAYLENSLKDSHKQTKWRIKPSNSVTLHTHKNRF